MTYTCVQGQRDIRQLDRQRVRPAPPTTQTFPRQEQHSLEHRPTTHLSCDKIMAERSSEQDFIKWCVHRNIKQVIVWDCVRPFFEFFSETIKIRIQKIQGEGADSTPNKFLKLVLKWWNT